MKSSFFLALSLPLLLVISACQVQRPALDDYLKGQLASDQNHLNEALADLSSAIEKNPQLSLAYMARGEVLKKKGDYEKAAGDFEKVTTMEPFNFDAHYQLGLMYQYLKRFTDAIRSYQKAVEIRPLDPSANMNLGLVYTQMGQPLRGLSYAQRAVAGETQSPQTHANLAALYAQIGYDDLAIAEFKTSIELNSRQPEVYLDLATEYMKQNQFELAKNVLDTARVLQPTAAVDERLGLCYYKLNRLEEAQTSYEAALKIDENYYQALNGLGVVSMKKSLQQNPADTSLALQAIAYWDRSLKIEPNQSIIRQLVQKYSSKIPASSQPSKVSPNVFPPLA